MGVKWELAFFKFLSLQYHYFVKDITEIEMNHYESIYGSEIHLISKTHYPYTNVWVQNRFNFYG